MSGEPRKTVLLVDDDELVLTHLETLLQNEGYETATVWSGVQALQLLRSSKFDLVLLDDCLPDIRSEDALKYIQRLAPRPRSLLCSLVNCPRTRSGGSRLWGLVRLRTSRCPTISPAKLSASG